MKFAFIARHRHIWPASWICRVLGVSRSGFHAWLGRPLSERAAHDAKLVQAIDRSFKASETLLHKTVSERSSPFPGRIYPTTSVTGMPRAV